MKKQIRQTKVCVYTGTRAEYGLLHWLLKALKDDPAFELNLVVTGAHLSPEYGLTYRQIQDDGFNIDRKLEMLLSSDSDAAITKSTALALSGMADIFQETAPDLLILLGDRYEILAAACAAMFFKIPIAHLYGGERTEGLIDEAVRHSVTKMAHIHFVANEAYRKRVIQLGEKPESVHVVGSLGLENVRKTELHSKAAFEEALGIKLKKRNLLITYHPVTLDRKTSARQIQDLLSVLDELDDTHLLFTKSNADADSRIINRMIDQYVADNPDKASAHTSLGHVLYLSALQWVDGVVGNSSSGIIEAPSFKIGTVNIGDRQRGRIRPDSVIDCGYQSDKIRDALKRLYSSDFASTLRHVTNPYGDGYTSEKIVELLKDQDLTQLLKKEFYDLPSKLKP